MTRPKYRCLAQGKRTRILEMFEEKEAIAVIAKAVDMSQVAVITVLEDEGCENVRPLALRRFTWQDEEDARS